MRRPRRGTDPTSPLPFESDVAWLIAFAFFASTFAAPEMQIALSQDPMEPSCVMRFRCDPDLVIRLLPDDRVMIEGRPFRPEATADRIARWTANPSNGSIVLQPEPDSEHRTLVAMLDLLRQRARVGQANEISLAFVSN